MHICNYQYGKKKKKDSKISGYSLENITILHDKTRQTKIVNSAGAWKKILLNCYYIYFKSTFEF